MIGLIQFTGTALIGIAAYWAICVFIIDKANESDK